MIHVPLDPYTILVHQGSFRPSLRKLKQFFLNKTDENNIFELG